MTTDEAAIRERWPACDDSEPGTLDSCRERRGHPGLHRSPTGSWGDDKRRIEDLTALLDAERAEVKRLRRAADLPSVRDTYLWEVATSDAVTAERARIAEEVEGLPEVRAINVHGLVSRAAVLAAIEGAER